MADYWNNFVRGLGTANAPFGFAPVESPSQGAVDPAYSSGMQMIGNIGMGMLASGERNPMTALGRSYLVAQQQAQEKNKDQYVAAKMLEEADYKKQERARQEQERKQREDFINTLPPDVRMKAMSIPGYLDQYIGATDPNLQKPDKVGYHEINGKLVDDNGRVVYDGGGSAEAPTTKTIYDEQTGQEQVVQWTPSGWVPIGGKKSKGDNRASATQLKELWKSEDELPVIDNTISALNRALELNDKTFTGYTAGLRGSIGAKMPGGGYIVDPSAAAATEEWGKIMSMEAIQNMASTLKGATTDKELRDFVSILADPNTLPDIRRRTIERMLTLSQRVKEIKQNRVNELRGSVDGGSAVTTEDGITIEEIPSDQ